MSLALYVSIALLLSILICVAVVKEMHKYDDFHISSQKLLEEIENEADKKGQNPIPLINDALQKLLENLKSTE